MCVSVSHRAAWKKLRTPHPSRIILIYEEPKDSRVVGKQSVQLCQAINTPRQAGMQALLRNWRNMIKQLFN